MSNNKRFLNRLIKVDNNYIGAVDDTVPILCKHLQGISYKNIIEGNVNNWDWISISSNEAENVKLPCIMFVKYIDLNCGFINMINNMLNTQKLNHNDNKTVVRAYTSGLMINNVLFMQDKYESKNFEFNLSTHDMIFIKHLNQKVEGYKIISSFNLANCSYYSYFD
jgi:hypothetical protein